MRTMNIIRSDKHEIYSMKINKIGMSETNDKRLIAKDKINTNAVR